MNEWWLKHWPIEPLTIDRFKLVISEPLAIFLYFEQPRGKRDAETQIVELLVNCTGLFNPTN